MIDPRAIAVQGIGYVAIVVATTGLLFQGAPSVSSGGGSYSFIEPYTKTKKKEGSSSHVSRYSNSSQSEE